ncbi:MAG: tail fiber domain-containing protein, partial [Acidobacteriota bacterium]
GPDGYVQKAKIADGEPMSLAFASGLTDGHYKWQVTMVEPLSADVRTAMKEARASEKPVRGFNVENYTFNGSFRVVNGAVIEPTPGSLTDDRDIATKDQVFNDDVVITFSACIGNDCVNGESFGFDTLRLKENNLRIHFQDTSNSASFPTNDWRLVANDTSNGGTNHFSIEDSSAGRSPFRVEAGASANALVVEADSDIGIGTLNPVVELHVVDGDSPTLRLEQDGSSGFTPQTFDLVSNEANFFIRDVTNGSQLPFRIKPGADTDTLFLDANNEVGIQTDSPGAPFHVRAGGSSFSSPNSSVVSLFQRNAATGDGAIISIISGNAGNAQMTFGDADSFNQGRVIYRNNQNVLSFWTSAAERLRVDADGDVCIGCTDEFIPADFVVGDAVTFSRLNAGDVMFTNTSSRAKKENLEEVAGDDILSKISDVGVFTYDYIDGPKDKLGLMAEDFHSVFGRGEDTMINGQEVQMALWLAVQELTAQNRELTQRLEELEAQKAE